MNFVIFGVVYHIFVLLVFTRENRKYKYELNKMDKTTRVVEFVSKRVGLPSKIPSFNDTVLLLGIFWISVLIAGLISYSE